MSGDQTPGEISSLNSSRAHRHSMDDIISKAGVPSQVYELEAASGSPPASPPPSQKCTRWLDRHLDAFERRNPRASAKGKKWLLYWRGPRPKVDHPTPLPLLDLDVDSSRWRVRPRLPISLRFSLALDTIFARATRPLTAPWIFILLAPAYIIALAFFVRTQSYLTPADDWLGCISTFFLKNDGCGLNGVECQPFNNITFDVRCPAQCAVTTLHEPNTVGDTTINNVPLIVGGGDDNHTYRSDSFICAAAVQAGMVSNAKGGCTTVAMVGNFTDYLPFTANGLTSIGFPSIFPSSFRFLSSTPLSHCSDLRWPALAFNVIITFLLFVLRPKPIVMFYSLFCIGFWHVTLFSQPRSFPPDIADAFGTFLPALFCAYGIWRVAGRFVLPPLLATAPLSTAILFLGPYWVGALENLTFAKVPIDRLTATDVRAQAGGIASLIVYIIVAIVLVSNQVRVIRKTGWLPHYAAWYGAGVVVVLCFAFLPGLQFRLHHYIIALVIAPGIAFPTRLSVLLLGLVVGLFINGTAAFNFASILQTAAELQRDGTSGSALPSFITNSTNYNASIPFAQQVISWKQLPPAKDGFDGFALVVDDVERFVGTALNFSLSVLEEGIPHFFRLALTSGGAAGDFTRPAILWPNGTWVDPRPGAT